MEEILNSLLEKPLAFILSLGGIIFLGLSGLTKFFQVEVEKTNSKRLFYAGIALIIVGIPIYYFIDNEGSNDLDVELVSILFYDNDEGHTCDPSMLHIREIYEIDNTNGERLFKVILNSNKPVVQEILYQDELGRYALNYCFRKEFEQSFNVIIITNSGKSSEVVSYTVDTKNVSTKENAPRLSKF